MVPRLCHLEVSTAQTATWVTIRMVVAQQAAHLVHMQPLPPHQLVATIVLPRPKTHLLQVDTAPRHLLQVDMAPHHLLQVDMTPLHLLQVDTAPLQHLLSLRLATAPQVALPLHPPSPRTKATSCPRRKD